MLLRTPGAIFTYMLRAAVSSHKTRRHEDKTRGKYKLEGKCQKQTSAKSTSAHLDFTMTFT